MNKCSLCDHIEYWKEITSELVKILAKSGVEVLDVYLVGSQTKKYIKYSDFDSLVIIKGSYNIYCIKMICDELARQMSSVDSNYHFKIFDLCRLDEACVYDAFRIKDFQGSFISFKYSGIIQKLSPVLSVNAYSNSILVQSVYGMINNIFAVKRADIVEERVRKWDLRNKMLCDYNLCQKINKSDNIYYNNDLLRYYYANFHKSKFFNKVKIDHFLKLYYQKIPHEYINKSAKYLDIIDNYNSVCLTQALI